MKTVYQIFGGALGWTLGGPIGALLGASLGSYFHKLVNNDQPQLQAGPGGANTMAADFHVSLLVLSAMVIKADGKIDKKELDLVRKHFVQMFGKVKANESFTVFKSIISQDIDVAPVCEEIRQHTTHAMRLQLVHFLFLIAQADGHVHELELKLIHRIATLFYIRKPDFDSIKSMFVKHKTVKNYYQILEISSAATEKEIKSAYRKMAKKYHPDRLIGLGEDVKKAAKQKFLLVQEAYDTICKERGIS